MHGFLIERDSSCCIHVNVHLDAYSISATGEVVVGFDFEVLKKKSTLRNNYYFTIETYLFVLDFAK